MKYILTLSVLCFTFLSQSQNIHFIKSYGNSGYDFGRDIKQDLDTGYIATGSSSSFGSGNADAFLLKVDSMGNFKWSYNYGGANSDWGESVVVTNDSSYAIGGYTNSFGNGGFDFYLVRADKDGTPLWEKTYGGSDWDKARSLVQLPDSGFVLVGDTYSYGNGNKDMYMIRTDKNGDTLWTKTYGGPADDYANAVILDGDSLVVVGGTESFGAGMSDGIILKYHIDGTLGWTKLAGMERNDYFTSVTKHLSGDYSLGGSRDYNHYTNCDCGNDFWVYKTNQSGSTLIDTTRGGSNQLGTDIINDLIVDNSDNTYYAGSTTSWGSPDISQDQTDAFIGKFLNNYYPASSYIGNFGMIQSDVANSIEPTFDNGTVSLGNMFHASTGGYNIFIAKIDNSNSFGGINVSTQMTNDNITLSVESINQSNPESLNIYPTFVTDYLYINTSENSFNYNIFDIQGRIIKSNYSESGELNLSDLKTGMYIIHIKTKDLDKKLKFFKN